MNKLPEDWEIKKLKDIGNVYTGITPPTSDKENFGNEHLFVTSADIKENKYIFNSIRKLSNKGFEKTKKFKKGDILYVCIGSIGKIALAKTDFSCNQQINVLRVNKEIDNEFIYYQLMNSFPYISKFISKRVVPIMNKTTFENLEISLPPLDEQKRIASALSKIDAYLENTIKLIEEKERFKRGIAKKLLTCKEGENIPEARFKGFEDEWEIVKLGDMFDNFKEKNNEDKIILASTIDKGVIPNSLTERKIIRKKESLSNYKLVKKGCFVISLMSFQSGFEYSDYEGIISPAYTVLKPKIEMAHYFYKYYFKSFKFIKDLRPYAEGIRHGKQIKFKACKDILVPYPSIEEQEKIGGYLSLLDKEIDNLKKQKELIKEMKRGAMQKLLSGEVRLLE